MIQTASLSEIAQMYLFLSFGHFIFEFVSNFDIRISIFGFRILPITCMYIIPSGLRPKPVRLGSDIYLPAALAASTTASIEGGYPQESLLQPLARKNRVLPPSSMPSRTWFFKNSLVVRATIF